jgi:hypothetical protein
MFRTEFHYFVVLIALILSTPFLPSSLLFLLDHLLIRVAMVALLLYFIHISPTVAVFGFVAISMLYLERNRRKVSNALKKLDAMDAHHVPQATVEEASTPQKTVPVQPFDTPSMDESAYVPDSDGSEQGMNFEPVDASINQKAVLSTIYPAGSASESQHLYEQMGFGHLDRVETLGETSE